MSALEKFDSSKKYTRHVKAYDKGGIHLKDEEGSTVNTRDILINLIKSVGGKLKEGKILDLLKISRPAIISYPKTYLQCIASDFSYTRLLDQAAACQDPVQRIKYVAAFFIAGFHRNPVEMGNTGPLNPVLGETFNAEKRDGTKLYCEQISHHPPVSAYLLVHPKGEYKLYGKGEVAAKLSGLNGVEGQRIGETFVEFKDGGKILIANAEMKIDGLIMGDRVLNQMKSFPIIDHANKISVEVTFSYTETGTLSKIGSSFKSFFKSSSSSDKPLSDYMNIALYNFDKNEETGVVTKTEIGKGSGSWLSHLELDNEVYWTVEDPVDDVWMTEDEKKLLSDSTYRLDSKYIKEKNYDKAQKEKELLENTQRQDAKLRKAH